VQVAVVVLTVAVAAVLVGLVVADLELPIQASLQHREPRTLVVVVVDFGSHRLLALADQA
jgi:thiol:disulfide interchange protein